MSEGQRAEEILNDPLVQQALIDIETAINEQWKITANTDLREELWYTLRGLDRFKEYMQIAIDNGRFDATMLALEND